MKRTNVTYTCQSISINPGEEPDAGGGLDSTRWGGDRIRSLKWRGGVFWGRWAAVLTPEGGHVLARTAYGLPGSASFLLGHPFQ